MGAKLFFGTLGMRNEVVLKNFGMGHVEMYGFYGNPFYDSREWV